MMQTKVVPTLQLILCSSLVLVAGCSTTGPRSGASATAPVSNTATAATSSTDATQAEKNLFANIKELDYSPPQQDYRIGPDDLLDIKVFQAPELSQPARVDPRGNISLPLLGTIRAEGMSQIELEKKLAQLLGAKYLQDPQVTVFIKESTAQRVTVEGEVKTSGVFPLKGEMTLLQSIALAGGLTGLADPAKTVLFRKQGNNLKAYNINLDEVRDGKLRDPYIRNDDRIIVHRSGARYWLREVGTLLNPIRMLQSF